MHSSGGERGKGGAEVVNGRVLMGWVIKATAPSLDDACLTLQEFFSTDALYFFRMKVFFLFFLTSASLSALLPFGITTEKNITKVKVNCSSVIGQHTCILI